MAPRSRWTVRARSSALARAGAERDPPGMVPGGKPLPALEPPASNKDETTMRVITDNPRLSRTEAAALLAEVRALHELVRELTVPRAPAASTCARSRPTSCSTPGSRCAVRRRRRTSLAGSTAARRAPR
jgi:hypothetical protein